MAQVIQYDATDRKFGNPPIATYQCGIARSHELRRELEEDGFSVEVFASDDVLPVQRFSVVGSVTVDIGAADGADNSEMVALNFAPLPALTVTVGYAPASWLLWLALVLTLVGLVGVLMPPGFLLLQLAAWPVDRTVLVAQSDHTDDIQAVVQTLPGLPAGQSGAEGSAHG